MLIVVSPAKNLDFESDAPTPSFTQPTLLEHSQVLIDQCKTLAPAEIASLMKISDKLSGLNADRFSAWSAPFSPDNAKAAVFAFNGDVYTGLDAASFSQDDCDFAQQHMRILSGLYGLLKPLDLMQAYRLEMGTKLINSRGKDLYQFWGDIITQSVQQALDEQGDGVLVNLASNEYFKSVKTKQLKGTVITPVFKDQKNGQYKIISFYAKKARGLMARYIIDHRLTDIAQLKDFDTNGYEFCQSESTDTTLVFTRQEQ
jgi:hypothetical protein